MNTNHARYACVVAQEFPFQALLRLRPEWQLKPVAVLDGEPPFALVCSLNGPARMLGVALGMSRLEMEMFPSALVCTRSRAEEKTARAALLECAGAFSPRVEDQSTDLCFTCVVDITGTQTLFGSPDAMSEKLLKKIQALRLEASIAVSSNFHAAVYMARGLARGLAAGISKGTNIRVVPRDMERSALALLPIEVLDLSGEHLETLSSWGISTLGALASLEETELIARLGQPGKVLSQAARGNSPHIFTPIEVGCALEEKLVLDSPVELLDSLLFIVGVLLDQLIVRAQARIVALASTSLHLHLEDGTAHVRTVRPALPNCDRKLWLKLIHLDLQAHPPQSAILALTLNALPGSTSKLQLGLFSPQVPEAMRLDVTLARIRSIVGDGCVGQAVLKDSHHPDAFSMQPFVVPAEEHASSAPQAKRGRLAMRQLRPPECVRVVVRDRRPDSFIFREKRYMIERAYGPWSSAGEWWRPTLWSIEQWDVVARAQAITPEAPWICCCLTHDLAQDSNQGKNQERWQVEALYD